MHSFYVPIIKAAIATLQLMGHPCLLQVFNFTVFQDSQVFFFLLFVATNALPYENLIFPHLGIFLLLKCPN